MKEYFIYDDKVYESEEAVDEAIIEKIGHNYNNIDVTQTGEFELEAQTIKTVTFDEAVALVFEKSNYTTVEPMTTTDRLKKFKETFDNYELARKQDFIAYENWLECEKELEELKQEVIARQETENSLTQWVADLTTELTELKRDVKRFMELDYQAKVGDFLDDVETNEYTRLHRKLNKKEDLNGNK